MAFNPRTTSETQKRRSLHRRMIVVLACLFLALILIISRLLELQVVRGSEFSDWAQKNHYGGVRLPAKRGEVLGVNSRTGEHTIFATNTTLDLIYVDPYSTDDPKAVAQVLADTLLTEEFHKLCSEGHEDCPREFIQFYEKAFDPLMRQKLMASGALLEPLPPTGPLPPKLLKLPSFVEARDLFQQDIVRRISDKRVNYAPLKYGATKVEMQALKALSIPGVSVSEEDHLAYANPEVVNQGLLESISKSIAGVLNVDAANVEASLRSRPLRYVPIMRRVPRELSLKLLEQKAAAAKQALAEAKARNSKNSTTELKYPLRSVALLPEHWRFYPDTKLASQIVGFLNTNQEAQYGVERTFNAQLRGRDGAITTANDLRGGQILRPEQKIESPTDGDTIVLTIDRAIQKEVETILQKTVEQYRADSAQVIVMDPYNGRILAMVNAPLFDSNNYASVFEKEPVTLNDDRLQKIVVEITHPETNARVVKDYINNVFTASGRTLLSEKIRKSLDDLGRLYDLQSLTRYYLYEGERSNLRRELFPTDDPHVWLKFKNNIGVGAYINRTVQEIYEPGSVMKAITMAIAIDQGEVGPLDMYDDFGPLDLQDDKKPIDNNDGSHYGRVTMVNCLEYSINTCMSELGFKLGPKLFLSMLERFGFSRITGIQLDDEVPGELPPWNGLPRRTLATISFGQGLSSSPLQMITAWAALANGGKLVRPMIIDSIIHSDGTTEVFEPQILDQVITPEASDTITAMLVSSATRGFANKGKVPGYRVAGKTGTSQIAGPGQQYESGTGSTIATYAGYAPVNHPKFLILVKLDRPKNATHGATVAAPVFQQVAAFLFRYYGIPPDDDDGNLRGSERLRQVLNQQIKPINKKGVVPKKVD